MAWANGRPGSNIPESVKRTIRHRQHDQCAGYDPTLCTGSLDEYDHIVNLKTTGTARAHANDPDLLQGLCVPCHRAKTQAEALAGRRRGRRPPPPHPADT